VPDRAALRAAVIAAARAFNSGRYFEAHEISEEALEEVPDDRWDLFVGLIQIAVGYHNYGKLENKLPSPISPSGNGRG